MKIYYPTAKNCDKNAKLKDYMICILELMFYLYLKTLEIFAKYVTMVK